MGFFQQLLLVLWKSIVLRISQPVVIVLEVFWPILIFLVVTLVRRDVPPITNDQCHYAPRASPTAGFSFVQDYACNLDNQCHPNETAAQTSRMQSDARKFISILSPLYSKREETENFLKKLPETQAAINSLAQALDSTELKELLDLEFMVRSFFREPQKVEDYLVNSELMTRANAQALMDATINITKVLELTGGLNFTEIFCSPEILAQYINIPSGFASVSQISSELCVLNSTMTADALNYLQSQLDIAEIIRIAKSLEGDDETAILLEDLATMVDLLINLNSTQDLLANLGELSNILGWANRIIAFIENMLTNDSLALIKLLGDILNDLDPLISSFVGSNQVYGTIRNLMQSYASIQSMFTGTQTTGMMNPLKLGNMFNSSSELMNLFSSFNLSSENIAALSNISFNDTQLAMFIGRAIAGNIDDALCNHPGLANLFIAPNNQIKMQLQQIQNLTCGSNSSQILDVLKNEFSSDVFLQQMNKTQQNPTAALNWTEILVDGAELISLFSSTFGSFNISLQDMFQQYGTSFGTLLNMSNYTSEDITSAILQLSGTYAAFGSSAEIDLFLYMTWATIDIMNDTNYRLAEYSRDIGTVFEDNTNIGLLLESMMQWDPERTPEIMARLLDPIRLQSLTESTSASSISNMVCDPVALGQFLALNDSSIDLSSLSQMICNANITSVLIEVANSFNGADIKVKVEKMIAVLEGAIPAPLITPEIISMQIQNLIKNMPTEASAVDLALMFLSLQSSITAGSSNWTQFSYQFTEYLQTSVGGSLLESTGQQLESSPSWFMIAPIVKSIEAALELEHVFVDFFTMMQDNTTEMGKVNYAVLKYLPHVMVEIGQLSTDQQKLQMLIQEATTDPMGVLCSYEKMLSYLEPIQDLPLQSLQQTLCQLNFVKFEQSITQSLQNLIYHGNRTFSYAMNTMPDVYETNVNWRAMYENGESLSYHSSYWLTMPSHFAWWYEFDYVKLIEGMQLFFGGMLNMNTTTLPMTTDMNQLIQNTVDSIFTSSDPQTMANLRYYFYVVDEYVKYLQSFMANMGENGVPLSDIFLNSQWLQNQINATNLTLSDVLPALGNTTIQPEQLIILLASANLTEAQLCQNFSLTQIFTLTNEADMKTLEQLLCGVDIMMLFQEVLKHPTFQDAQILMNLLTTYNASVVPAEYSLNMTRSVTDFINIITAIFTSTDFSNNFTMEMLLMQMPLSTFNASDYQSTATDLINQLMSNMVGQMESSTTIVDILNNVGLNFAQMFQDLFSPMFDTIPGGTQMMDYYLYATNQFMLHAIKILQLWGQNGISLYDLLGNSTWLHDRLNETNQVLPDVITGLNMTSLQPEQLLLMMTSMNLSNSQLCTNVSLAEILMIPKDVNIQQLESIFCGIDITVLTQELLKSPLLKDFNDMLYLFQNSVNYTVPANYQRNFTELYINSHIFNSAITSLFENTINGQNGFETILANLITMFDSSSSEITNLLNQVTSMDMNSLSQLMQLLNPLLSDPNMTLPQNMDISSLSSLMTLLNELGNPNSTLLQGNINITSLISSLMPLFELFISSNDTLIPGNLDMSAFSGLMTMLNTLLANPNDMSMMNVNISSLESLMSMLNMLLINSNDTLLPGNLDFTALTGVASMLNELLSNPNSTLFQGNMDITSFSGFVELLPMLLGSSNGTLSQESNLVLAYIDGLVEFHIRSILVLDPVMLDSMFPSIAWYRNVIDASPYILNMALLGLLESGQTEKVAIITDPFLFCNTSNFGQLITLPPDAAITPEEQQKTLCDANTTALMMELNGIYMYLMEPLAVFSTPDAVQPVNVANLMQKIAVLEDAYASLNISNTEMVLTSLVNVFKWFNGEIYVENAQFVLNYTVTKFSSQDPLDYASLFQGFELLGQMLNLSALNPPLNMINAALTQVNMKLAQLNTGNSLADMFPNSPESAKLARMMEHFPYILELVGNSYTNNLKFQMLITNSNMTEVFLALCHPLSNFSSYFSIPNSWSAQGVNLTALRQEFCAINVSALESEFTKEFNVPEIQNQLQNMAPVNWTVLYYQLNMLLGNIDMVISAPPREFTTGTWNDSAVWINILMSFNQQSMTMMTDGSMNNSTAITESLLTQFYLQVESLKTMLDPSSAGALDGMAAAFNQMVTQLNNQLYLLSKPNLSLYDIFADSPETLNFLRPADDVTGLTDALLKVPLANTTTLLLLMNETPQSLCNKPLSFYMESFQITDTTTAEGLRNFMCQLDPQAWGAITDEMVNKFGLAAILSYLNMNTPGNVAGSTFDWQILGANIEALSANIMQVLSSNIEFAMPSFNMSVINATIAELYSNINEQNIDTILPAIMDAFAPLYGTDTWNMIMQYQNTFDVVFFYLNDMLALLTPGLDGQLDIQVLFGNSSEWLMLLSNLSGIAPELSSGLSQVNVQYDMLNELINLNTSGVAELLCSEQLMHKYFVFPPSLNVSQIVASTCGVNVTALMQEFEQQFNIAEFMYRIMNPMNTTDMNVEGMIQRYMQFIEQLMALGNITDVAFFSNTIGQFVNLDPSTLMPTAAPGQSPTDILMANEFANIKTMAEALDLIFQTITTTLAQLQTIPQDASYSAFLRILDTALTTALERLQVVVKNGTSTVLEVGDLVGNIPELTSLLEMQLSLDPEVVTALLQAQVPPEVLLTALSGNMSTLQEFFCNTNATTWFPAGGNFDVNEVQFQLCTMDYNKLWEVIKEYINYNEMYVEFMKLVNPSLNMSSQVPFNWTAYAENVGDWEALINMLLMNEIKLGESFSNLTALFDPASIMNSFSGMMQQQITDMIINQTLSSLNLDQLFSDLNMPKAFVVGFTSSLQMWTEFLQNIQDNGFTFSTLLLDTEALAQTFATFTTLGVRAQMEASAGTFIRDVFEKLPLYATDFSSTVCTTNGLKAVLETYVSPAPLYWDTTGISYIMCTNNNTMWYDVMLRQGFKSDDIFYMAAILSIHYQIPSINEELLPFTPSSSIEAFNNILTELNDLDQFLSNMSPSELQGVVDNTLFALMTGFQQSEIPFSIELTRLMDILFEQNGLSAEEMRKTVYMLAYILDYTNTMISDASNGTHINLGNLVPDETNLKAQLSSMLSDQAINDFLALSMDPVFIQKLTNNNTWQSFVCNETAFIMSLNTSSNIANFTQLASELCTAAQNGNNIMDILMSYVDYNMFISQILQMVDGTTLIDQNPYTYLESQLQNLMTNIGLLTNNQLQIDLTGMNQWLNMFAAATGQMPNMTSMTEDINSIATDVCSQTISILDNILGPSNTVAQSLHINLYYMEMYIQYLEAYPLIVDMTCDLQTSSLSQLYHKYFNNTLLTDVIFQFAAFAEMDVTYQMLLNQTQPINCVQYMESMNNYTMALEKYYTVDFPALNDRLLPCLLKLVNEPTFPVVDDIEMIFGMIAGVQEIYGSLLGQNLTEIAPYIDIIARVLIQEEPLTMRLRDMLLNATSFEKMLSDVFKLTPETINALMDSSIEIYLDTILYFYTSEDDLRTVICETTSLQYLNLPNEIDINTIIAQVCASNSSELSMLVKDVLNFENITYMMIIHIPKYYLSSDWITNLLQQVSTLTSNFEQFAGLPELLQNFNFEDMSPELLKILTFVENGDLNELLTGVRNIIDMVKTVVQNESLTNQMFQDVYILIDGLQSLTYFRRLFGVRLSDLVLDPVDVENYMTDTLGLSEDVATSLIRAYLSPVLLLNLSQSLADSSSLTCNATNLATLLTLNNNTSATSNQPPVTIDDISAELCTMGEEQLVNLIDFIKAELHYGKIMQLFVTIDPTKILEDIGVSVEELQNVASSFQPVQEAFTQFSTELENLPSTVLASAAQLQTGNADTAMTGLSQLLCGRQNAFSLVDEYQLQTGNTDTPQTINEPAVNGTVRKKRQASTTSSCVRDTVWTTWQSYEITQMNTPFCKDMYKSLQCTENGRVIWSFLKPLLVGKIPYTPRNNVTLTIMVEVERIFRDVDQIAQFAQAFIDSSPTLSEFSQNTDQLNIIENAIQNPLIYQAVESIMGNNPQDLISQLNSFTNINSTQINAIVDMSQLVSDVSKCVSPNRIEHLNDEEELLVYADYYAIRNNLLAAIVFEDMKPGNTDGSFDVCNFSRTAVPSHIKYKIRMRDDNTPKTESTNQFFWLPGPEDSFSDDLRYFRGFIQLQDLVDRAIIKLQTGCQEEMPTVEYVQFPYPCYEEDKFQKYVSLFMFPVMMVLAMLAFVGSSIKNIVYDKEHRLEEAMLAMGMKSGVVWIGWFLSAIIVALIMDIIIVIMLHFGNLFRFTDFGLLFVYLAVFSFYVLMLCYFVSVFFYRTTLAALAGIMVYLVSYVPYIVLANMYLEMEFWHIAVACLSGTTAFSFGSQMLSHMEQRGEGMQWNSIGDGNLYPNFSFAWVFYMMLIDSAIFLILGLYIRNIIPGKYGVSQPWYFPFSPKYWRCSSCTSDDSNSSKYKPQSGVRNAAGEVVGENDPSNLPIGISLHGITKGNRVRNLTVNIFQEQITAFLGQNGAGKTTTMNILTGIFEPSSGNAFIKNHSIKSSMGEIRRDLGICPQQDTLFEYMTVQEHMNFFANLKGKLSKTAIKEDVSRMLEQTGLEDSKKVKVSQLSGGQRRRLSVGLAFIGGSSVVILDEPTSGIDSCARRSIWDLIVQNRPGKTILISTHHLDEADVLGDRIIMIHKGSILCAGSPLYLKSQYGSGYQLTMSRNVNRHPPHYGGANSNDAVNYNTADILEFIRKYVPESKLVEEVGTEMTFLLPTNSGQLAKFSLLFHQIEIQKSYLGIDTYGVSDTTIEEIFLKLTLSAENNQTLDPQVVRDTVFASSDQDYKKAKQLDPKTDGSSVLTAGIERPNIMHSTPRNSPFVLSHIMALWLKRFWHHIRDFRSYLSQFILPIMFICLAMGLSLIVPGFTNQPSLLLTPEIYITHDKPESYAFYKLEQTNELFQSYEQQLLNFPFGGVTCVEGSDFYEGRCDQSFTSSWRNLSYTNTGVCTCDRGRQTCLEGNEKRVPYLTTGTGLSMLNITDNKFVVAEYLSRTLDAFIKKRYGGFQFKENQDQNTTTIWYNNKGWHALPSYQNAFSNILLRSRLSGADNVSYGISTYNHPLPQTKTRISQETLLRTIAENGLAITILCAFCFIPAGYTIFLVSERVNKEKQLQLIYGIDSLVYWSTTIVWDLLAYSFSVALAVAITYAFGIDTYTARQNLAGFAVTLLLFGWATIPLMYIMSRFFNDVSIAYLSVFLINFFIGVITIITTFLLSLFTYEPGIQETYNILNHVFKIFPPYCLGDCLVRLSSNQFETVIYEEFHLDKYKNPFSFDMMAWHLIAMAIQGLVFFIINLILDLKLSTTRLNNGNQGVNYKEDSDVSLERQRVITGDARSDTLVIHNLRKIYRRGFKKVHAVENITFGVPKGECFGLLGVNGAGKTTTFHMITAEVEPTMGGAILNGRIISEYALKMQGDVGYCPQSDALDDFLTGRELLYFYARIKGVPNMHFEINYLSESLGLTKYIDKVIKSYSGGTKRKLSTAIAMLGNPKLLLLDEPTTGMDASSRRLVWDRITEVIKSGTSVLLTSHSMPECDALCTRMGIMVNGRFMCLGNGQHLKRKYGSGYTVITRVSGIPPGLDAVINFMKDTFEGTILKDSYMNQLEFEIPMANVRLGDIFGQLESEKSWLHLQEYSVSQPTLEQVFNNFARSQTDGMEDNYLDIEANPNTYANQVYGTIGTPTTPVLPRGRETDVRESLRSIPGYGTGEVDSSDVHVDVSDKPSTSGSGDSANASGSHSPASTLPSKSRPISSEITVIDPETGAESAIIHDNGKTIVQF